MNMSNYPPGVSDNMIPGNRPEDIKIEMAEESLLGALSDINAEPDEIRFITGISVNIILELRRLKT